MFFPAAKLVLPFTAALLSALSFLPRVIAVAADPPAKSAHTKPDGGQSKGTEQLKGGDGVFGVVYTMQSGLNVQLIKARYTLEPHNSCSPLQPHPDQKLFVLTFAVKNPNKDTDVNFTGIEVTLVDENENNYESDGLHTRLQSNDNKVVEMSLKPGQGVGQDPAVNELSVAIAVPGKAKIKKILLKGGRATVPDEKVLRFNIAGTTGGSPKNVIAPLPKYAADPTDPTGAIALDPAAAIMGKYYPDGFFALRLDGVVLSADTLLEGSPAPEGKQWAIATFTAKNFTFDTVGVEMLGGDATVLRDTDGEKYPIVNYKRKAAKDEFAGELKVDKGEEVTFRQFFAVPKTVKLKSLLYASGPVGHNYLWDLSVSAATP